MTAAQFNEWRQAMGLTVAQAADRLGVSRQTANTWARGETAVPRPVVLACAALQAGITGYSAKASTRRSRPSPMAAPAEDPFVLCAPFSGPPGMPS